MSSGWVGLLQVGEIAASEYVLIAYLGYTFTFGVHDSTILARSLIGVIALPILLLTQAPALARRGAS